MPVPANFTLLVFTINKEIPKNECRVLYELTRNVLSKDKELEELLRVIIIDSMKYNYDIIKTIEMNKDLSLLLMELELTCNKN